jgi:hypothetical protein
MTPTTEPSPTLPAAPAYPPEVEAFCAAHGLRPHLDTAVRLAREVFPAMRGFTTEVVEDPGSPRTWVTLRVVVPPGTLDANPGATWEYTRREVKAIPSGPAEFIRLAVDVG